MVRARTGRTHLAAHLPALTIEPAKLAIVGHIQRGLPQSATQENTFQKSGVCRTDRLIRTAPRFPERPFFAHYNLNAEMCIRLRPVRIIVIASFSVLYGQHLGVEAPHEAVGNPTSKPLPRRRIAVDPITLYRGVLSPLPEERKRAYEHLGVAFADGSQPVDARLYAVNLDADAGLEYMLIASGFPASTIAVVFAKDGEGWWMVGQFSYWWHWSANEAERFIELREIVWPGRKEIIVREQGGGTGFAETNLSIYRLHKGYLYRIFQTTEDAFHYVYGGGRSEYEHRDLEYLERDNSDRVFVVVRYEKRTEFDQHSRRTQKARSCSVFRWDGASFSLGEDMAASAEFCMTRTAP